MTIGASVLDRVTGSDCREYLRIAQLLRPSLDVDALFQRAQAATRYYRSGSSDRVLLRAQQSLEARWYDSLTHGEPDYSVYDDEFFISDLWACWVVYSRNHLRALCSPHVLRRNGRTLRQLFTPRVQTIGDLGCGFGYTTAGLKELFPRADVYGTNLQGTLQFEIAAQIGKNEQFGVSEHARPATDLILASEFFEHLESPIDYLEQIISTAKPKVFILANSFRAVSIGHFPHYKHQDALIANTRISRLFNKMLRTNGYVMLRTRFWNNRPTIWYHNSLKIMP